MVRRCVAVWSLAVGFGCASESSPSGSGALDASAEVGISSSDVAADSGGAPDLAPQDAAEAGADVAAEVVPGIGENFGVVETEGDADCENVGTAHCLLPFPSDRFLVLGVDGLRRVQFQPNSLPVAAAAGSLDPGGFAEHDGFSTATPILLALPGATLAAATALATVDDLGPSLLADHATALIDATTGERVAHSVELDHFARQGSLPVVTLRPGRRLAFGRRFVVAVRGLRSGDGVTLPADPGFLALRDGTASRWKGVHARRDHFETQVFPVLKAAGVARAELQLAFDFTTATEANATGLLLTMRDAMLTAIGTEGPEYTIDSVEELGGDSPTAKIVHGTAKIPSFLDGPKDGLRRIRRDAQGKPVLDGFESIAFDIQFPKTALDPTQPKASVLQYGHGLFGSRAEAKNGWMKAMANERNAIVVSIDMQGMSESDVNVWAVVLGTDIGKFPQLHEKTLQGIVNHHAIAQMMIGRFAKDTDPRFTRSGAPAYDPARVYYYGNSQGGTFGSLIMATHPTVTRGVLGVPGCAFSMLLNRSVDFTTFQLVLEAVFPDWADFATIFALMQTAFDRLEPLSYAGRMTEPPFPNTPPHRVLLHVAKEDAQVENHVSFLLGRTIGAQLLTPAVRPVWGMAEVPYPLAGNGLVEFDFGKPTNPDPTAPPPKANDTHGLLRQLPVGQKQLWQFLETGEIQAVCDGACDPS